MGFPHQKYSEETIRRIVELYEVNKFGCKAIAEATGLARTTIRKNLIKNGVKMRSPGFNEASRTKNSVCGHLDQDHYKYGRCIDCYDQDFAALCNAPKHKPSHPKIAPDISDISRRPGICEKCGKEAFFENSKNRYKCFYCRWTSKRIDLGS